MSPCLLDPPVCSKSRFKEWDRSLTDAEVASFGEHVDKDSTLSDIRYVVAEREYQDYYARYEDREIHGSDGFSAVGHATLRMFYYVTGDSGRQKRVVFSVVFDRDTATVTDTSAKG
jgi:hypothetical protein